MHDGPGEDHPASLIARIAGSATTRDVLHAGRRVRWRSFGHGAPLVLLHGGHGSWMHWIRNVQSLAQSHRVLVPDLPGFHDSDLPEERPNAPDGLTGTIDALEATLTQLIGASTSFDLAGFSFGGLVAAKLAADGGRVRRMSLIGPAGHSLARRQTTPLKNWRVPDLVEAMAALRHNLEHFMLHDVRSADPLALAVHVESCRNTRFRSKALSRSDALMSPLQRVACPLLMLWGEHDVTACPSELGETLRDSRTEREWCILPGAGHWVQFERAHDVNRLLLNWFKPD